MVLVFKGAGLHGDWFSWRLVVKNIFRYYQPMYHEQQVSCPYCGEWFTLFIDLSQGRSEHGSYNTIEDCYVCCRPIEFSIETDGEQLLNINANTDDD